MRYVQSKYSHLSANLLPCITLYLYSLDGFIKCFKQVLFMLGQAVEEVESTASVGKQDVDQNPHLPKIQML